MKYQSIQIALGAAAIACSILPAAAQDQKIPGIRMIEVSGSSDARPAEMMKQIEERLKQSNVAITPERHQQMLQSMRRAMDKSSPWMIGVMAEPIGDLLRTHLDLPKESGLIVSEIVDGSPAAKAGLVVNDILVLANDRKISDIGALKEAVQAAGKTGQALKLTIIHEGKRRQVSIEPDGPKPKQEKQADQPAKRGETDRAVRPGAEMFARQNRRFEEINGQLRRMNQQLEKQQKQIEMLEKRVSDSNKKGPRPPAHPPTVR